jgi:hypothetical protein
MYGEPMASSLTREACPCRKSCPDVMMVQSAKNRQRRTLPAAWTARGTGESFASDRCVGRRCSNARTSAAHDPDDALRTRSHDLGTPAGSSRSSHSAQPFCQGDRGAVGLSRMPMARAAASIISEAEDLLRTAEFGLEDMKLRPGRARSGLRNAVVFGRISTFALRNLRSVVPEFDAWYRRFRRTAKPRS